ncbi:16S rRNA (adenine(1518)-N(6)/adenine(1519)-N(6))-dimethyltransferase RsmA [Robiginitalea sp. M366]|uniref:16S rRNA (adenine(1518)-N(6)/adenine(1519)-N(6))- dimethyltransferase RsmA n=1 Tax=Robiginitalea aestuariiviva TaxID=3036903 RepID=UPI00240E1DAA|nr:16S rRNA (adenine(1518)-N(6)/adenine(1519)-N(6))-dimethyltransferase RsmA [Robiginitalea aestuariiviva]MDG1571190.1 16S rRNA (adenine(1518)-N(6)/adenine(1519)-N(6))-dimethyltransferase RsmA [Robiginitalea aestuariiviva]
MSRKKPRKKDFPGKKGMVQRNTGVRAKKNLGQHFLADAGVAARIAGVMELDVIDRVLEIGPGTGVLTAFLLERPIDLLAVELDPESATYLREVFAPLMESRELPYKHFEVLEADFLKLDLTPLFGGQPFAVTGNFPYNISSQILFRVLEARDRIPEFGGMFQKEVAERVCAGPGSKAYGILSVLVQAYYEASYCFTVPPEVFDPPPKVASGVLHLKRLKQTQDWDAQNLKTLVKAAFNQRRKTLRNSLKNLPLPDNLREDAIFDRRPEQLSVAEFIALSKHLNHDAV